MKTILIMLLVSTLLVGCTKKPTPQAEVVDSSVTPMIIDMDPVPEPIVEPVAEPVVESVPEPIVEPVAEPM